MTDWCLAAAVLYLVFPSGVDVSPAFFRLKNDLEWRPTVDLRTGVQKTWEYLREHLSHYV